MSSHIFRALLLLAFAPILGCNEQNGHEVSATAASDAFSDGSVTARKVTAREKRELEAEIQKQKAIDERFPGSATPFGLPSERVTDVSVPGVLKLEGGRAVRLDGVRCNEEAVGYLRRWLQGATVSVVTIATTESTSQPVPVEAWAADTRLQADGLAKTPAYSNILETAITSGWCQVEATPTSKRIERYAALAQAFQHPNGAR
jgi:hypothetical protein